jgi:hypothetical protein
MDNHTENRHITVRSSKAEPMSARAILRHVERRRGEEFDRAHTSADTMDRFLAMVRMGVFDEILVSARWSHRGEDRERLMHCISYGTIMLLWGIILTVAFYTFTS